MPDWQVPLVDVVVERAGDRGCHRRPTAPAGSAWARGRSCSSERFAEYVGAEHAIAVANGTAALHLICLAAGLGPGDEVIVPSLTFVATVERGSIHGGETRVRRHRRARRGPGSRPTPPPRSPATHPGDPRHVLRRPPGRDRRARGSGRRAGVDAARGRRTRARRQRSPAARSGPSGWRGPTASSPTRTSPSARAAWSSPTTTEIAKRVRLLRSHGMTVRSWDRHRRVTQRLRRRRPRFQLPDRRAARRLRRRPPCAARLRQRARGPQVEARYREAIERMDGVVATMPAAEGVKPAHHLFTVLLDEGVDRDGVRESLAEAASRRASITRPCIASAPTATAASCR